MTWLLAIAITYAVLAAILVLFEKRFIFFPDYPGRLAGDWNPPSLAREDVWLTAADGVKLHAWWIPAPQAEFTLIYFHGNAANITNRAEIYAFLSALPANVLALEYRGYGKSEGQPSEAGIYLDAEAAYNYVTQQRGVAPNRVISFGVSLGTAVATELALRKPVGGVVLEAPFGSVAAVAKRVYPFLPGIGTLARTKLDVLGKIDRIHAPLLVMHCTQDPVIAIGLGEAVFNRGREPKEFLKIAGVCHEGASDASPQEYRAALLRLFERIQRAP